MSVTLRKGTHRWLFLYEENVSLCRFCGTELDAGQSPTSNECTAMHDAGCVCDRCRARGYRPGQMVEILREKGRELSETFGVHLPQAEVVELLDNGRIKVQPGSVAYPVRGYTLNMMPEDIQPLTH
ncbi:hypothetical protein ABZZ79_01290 [Streptomyces sp. NPDC006458]|uniref:hypothetical protein n=1 Tax=Streptomyces sp. NPDC006458 TaxID=3154302 RepID=UPI0033BB1D6B